MSFQLMQGMLGASSTAPQVVLLDYLESVALNSGTHNVNMPTVVPTGAMLMVFANFVSAGSTIVLTTPAGWTLLLSGDSNSLANMTGIYYKIATGTEGGTVINFSTANTFVSMAAQTHMYGGTTGVPTGTGISNATSMTPNPPSHTSLGPGELYWICGFGSNGSAAPISYPAGFTLNQRTTITGAGSLGRIISCAMRSTALTVDPGNFTMGANTNARAFTVAIRPGA